MKVFIPHYPVSTPELKYTLRSLSKNMPNSGVVISCNKLPDWVQNVEFVPYDDLPGEVNKGNNQLNKLMAAMPLLSDDFIYCNDDYILIEPWEFKVYTHNTLKQIDKSNSWGNIVKKTIGLIGDQRSFQIHCPFVFNKRKFLALEIPNVRYGLCMETIYAHTYGIEGTEYPDCKLRYIASKAEIQNKISGRKFFSTLDSVWNAAMVEVADGLFPEKCVYEK